MKHLAITALLAAAPAAAQQAPAPDYAQDSAWLCRPGLADSPCDTDLSATALPSMRVDASAPAAAAAPVDCFYVYPTVSAQKRPNADGTVTDSERYVARQQAARFRSACRVFAPLYRQTTLAQLRNEVPAGDGALAYSDVKRAWDAYLAANPGRGVILVGHSQGSRHLQRLVAEEIAGKPVQSRVVAAYLPGFNIAVPRGRQSGGDLGSFPLCTSASQTGCAVAWTTFRAETPPPATSRYGRAANAAMRVACVNPARLAGDGTLISYLPSRPAAGSGVAAAPPPAEVPTPYLRLDGLVTGDCVDSGGASYLAVSTRVPRLQAQLAGISAQPDWGLHVVDLSLVQGNVVELAKLQAAAWVARTR